MVEAVTRRRRRPDRVNEPVLRWSARAHSIADIEKELGTDLGASRT